MTFLKKKKKKQEQWYKLMPFNLPGQGDNSIEGEKSSIRGVHGVVLLHLKV